MSELLSLRGSETIRSLQGRLGAWLVRDGGGRSEQGSPPCECWHALSASVFAAAMLCKNELRTPLLQAARVAIWLPCKGELSPPAAVTEGLTKIVIHPASQRSHVRAIECDLY